MIMRELELHLLWACDYNFCGEMTFRLHYFNFFQAEVIASILCPIEPWGYITLLGLHNKIQRLGGLNDKILFSHSSGG